MTKFGQRGALAGFKAVGLRSGFFVGSDVSTYSFVYPLPSGYNVTRAKHFGIGEPLYSGFGKLALLGNSGFFEGRGYNFIGFTFNNRAGRQYGWARIYDRGLAKHNSFRILGYAYADVGETILVGQTTDESSPGAEESLGALALGGAGLTAWRKRRASGR